LPKENFLHEHWILVIGGAVAFVYAILAIWMKKFAREMYIDLLAVIIGATSAVTGFSIMCKIITNHASLIKTANLEESDIIYFIIGGGLICWNAGWETFKKFKELCQPVTE
jgi:hypothetical protein